LIKASKKYLIIVSRNLGIFIGFIVRILGTSDYIYEGGREGLSYNIGGSLELKDLENLNK